jgi:hypothetical protein
MRSEPPRASRRRLPRSRKRVRPPESGRMAAQQNLALILALQKNRGELDAGALERVLRALRGK